MQRLVPRLRQNGLICNLALRNLTWTKNDDVMRVRDDGVLCGVEAEPQNAVPRRSAAAQHLRHVHRVGVDDPRQHAHSMLEHHVAELIAELCGPITANPASRDSGEDTPDDDGELARRCPRIALARSTIVHALFQADVED